MSGLSRYHFRHEPIDEVVDVRLMGGPDHEFGQTGLKVGVELTVQIRPVARD
jgi:hypothetical protein